MIKYKQILSDINYQTTGQKIPYCVTSLSFCLDKFGCFSDS